MAVRRKTSTVTSEILTIGQLAKRAGVGIETIRFYEREGVIEPPARRESGYREFGPDAVARLRFIRRAQELGFSLKEIVELLALKTDTKRDCSGVKRRAMAKIEAVERKLRDLRRIRTQLLTLTAACDESRPIQECPILRAFEKDEISPAS